MKNLLVTVSGGRSSACMARHIQTYPKYTDYNKAFVFCNTGMERPETIDFLKNIVKYWEIPLTIIEGVYSTEKGVGVGYKVVDFETMDMQAQTFANMIAHYNKGHYNGLPNMGAPYCSDYLKINIDLDTLEQIISKLLPTIDVGKSPLTGNMYKGFSREFIKGSCKVRKWIAKMQIDE